MNLIKTNQPMTCKVGGTCEPKSDLIFGFVPQVFPRPSEAFLVSFWTDEKPYKCIGSKWGLKGILSPHAVDGVSGGCKGVTYAGW